LATPGRKSGLMRIINRNPMYISVFVSGPISFMLWPLRLALSLIYLLAVTVRNLWYDVTDQGKEFMTGYSGNLEKIISIGNIEAGGTGKTPVTIELAREIMNKGDSVVVVMRGYKRHRAKGKSVLVFSDDILTGVSGGGDFIVVKKDDDENEELVEITGDEALIYRSNGIPVVVDSNRERGISVAVKFVKPRFILLDDAFQRRSLTRDLDIVLLDHMRPLDGYLLLPSGYLREMPSALKRADVVIFTRSRSRNVPETVAKLVSGKPYFFASFKQGVLIGGGDETEFPLRYLEGKNLVLFSGVAKPELFEEGCLEAGLKIDISFRFMDHHSYSRSDVIEIVDSAPGSDSIFLTTEKDYVKVKHIFPEPERLFAMKLSVEIEKVEELLDIIYRRK